MKMPEMEKPKSIHEIMVTYSFIILVVLTIVTGVLHLRLGIITFILLVINLGLTANVYEKEMNRTNNWGHGK